MTTLYLILIIVAHVIIGGFMAGLLDEQQYPVGVAIFWPIILLFLLLIAIVYGPFIIGQKLLRWFEKKKEKK